MLKSNSIKLQVNSSLWREMVGWLGFASGGCFWGWIYGNGWRGSEWEQQPQPCWDALGFQGLDIFFIEFPFIQQENWLFSFLTTSFLSPQGRGDQFTFYSDGRQGTLLLQVDGSKTTDALAVPGSPFPFPELELGSSSSPAIPWASLSFPAALHVVFLISPNLGSG